MHDLPRCACGRTKTQTVLVIEGIEEDWSILHGYDECLENEHGQIKVLAVRHNQPNVALLPITPHGQA
jgi:hypothetical protein